MQLGLVSRRYKKFSKINSKKNNLIRNWVKDGNKYFSTEDIWMVNNHIRCSTSLSIREKQIKAMISLYT